jgi:F0F1-type ATP synthase assembly protein I
MLDVALFKNLRFTAASGSITIGFFTLAGFTFLITQYFQFVKGYSPFATGLRILPVAISVAAAAIVGTKLAVRIGNKSVVAAGLVMFGAMLQWIAAIASSTTPYGIIVLQMILGGTGVGLISAPATEAIMGAVAKEKAGVGSAVNDATRLFGATLGVAVVGSIAASLYASHLGAHIPAGLPENAVAAAKTSVGGGLIAAQQLARAGASGPADALSLAAIGAFLHSMTGALRVAGGVSIAGSILAIAFLPARPRAADEHSTVVAPSSASAGQPERALQLETEAESA